MLILPKQVPSYRILTLISLSLVAKLSSSLPLYTSFLQNILFMRNTVLASLGFSTIFPNSSFFLPQLLI